MPIEVRELIVRARVREDNDPGTTFTEANIQGEEPASIREAVEQVLDIIKRRKER